MFFYFFNEYKMEIYNKRIPGWKNLKPSDWLLFFMMISVPVVIWLATEQLQRWQVHILWYGVALIAIYGLIFTIGFAMDRRVDRRIAKDRQNCISRYQERIIGPVSELLQATQYRMYNEKSVRWLLKNCQDNIPVSQPGNNKTKKFFNTIVLPILLAGTAATVSLEEFVWATAIALALIGVAVVAYFFAWLDTLVTHREAPVYRALKEELEYILTLLPQEQGADSVHKRICPKARKKAH